MDRTGEKLSYKIFGLAEDGWHISTVKNPMAPDVSLSFRRTKIESAEGIRCSITEVTINDERRAIELSQTFPFPVVEMF